MWNAATRSISTTDGAPKAAVNGVLIGTLYAPNGNHQPGAPGVGASRAAALLQRYGTLEAALNAGRFPAQAESLRLYRSIATMNRKAPMPSLRNQNPTWRKAAERGDWELNQLAKRLEELASG